MTTQAPGIEKKDFASRFVAHLVALAEREDRAALAALRSGLGKQPGEAPAMFPYVEPCLGETGNRKVVEAAYTVASLFGLHPHHRDAEPGTPERNRSFGRALRAIRKNGDGSENEGVTRRFVALLNCDRDALPTHLRHLVQLLKSKEKEAHIDFVQLYYDILNWDDLDRRVHRNWAAGFWGGVANQSQEEPAGDSPDAGANDGDLDASDNQER